LPLKRIGTSEEVAHAVRYLIENTYTTGTVLFPDGGYLNV
jgi:NAD(P)-dependent dehydrogenase (short-subunit alcohol dehydrogenase family)